MQGSDTGAIDSGARWINRGTVVRHNLFFSIGNHADGACNSNFQCELPTSPWLSRFLITHRRRADGNCSWAQGKYGCKVIDGGRVAPTNCSTPGVYVDQ